MMRPRLSEKQFAVTSKFPGYRNREDITNLPPGLLVSGSQNVMTNTSGRLAIVKGYTLDGAASAIIAPIMASFDVIQFNGNERNLRCYTDPSDNKGHLQFRYVSGTTVTWRDLIITLNSSSLQFVDWWDNTEKKSVILFCDGSSNVYEWSGGVTTVASVTSNTITKQGTKSWAEEGFYSATTQKIVIRGVEYTYTGGAGTTTLTGVTPDPTAQGANTPVAGDVAQQQIITTPASSITSLPATFKISLLASLVGQVYFGSLVDRQVYVSKLNTYKDVGFTSPVRVVGEGALVTLDGTLKALVPQENTMYMSAGQDFWYEVKFTKSSDLTKEVLDINRLKTASKQAAQSQYVVTKDKNNVIFISNEPVLSTIGRVSGVIATPQAGDLSYSIVNDMNSYDFTDASTFYFKNFVLMAIPKHGLIRIYNQTNPNEHYWEAPVLYPISRFSVIGGALYGHSYNSPETYKLFDGYNFNSQPIEAIAAFSYNNHGSRTNSKGYNQYYVEGYISSNTDMELRTQKDTDGNMSEASFPINGSDKQIVGISVGDNSVGKNSLGKAPFGGNQKLTSAVGALPPKFRVIKTMPIAPYFYEERPVFYSSGIDFQWELLAFGCRLVQSQDLNNNIKQ